MLKVLLVEDNILIREELMQLIDWEAHDYQLVGGACDGEEALGMLEELAPDIILTDIKMPVMDGLSLIREGKQRMPDAQFVVLSAYDEFCYVSEAFKLGAVDYILKLDISESTLLVALDKAAQMIRHKQEERERWQRERETLDRLRKIESYLQNNTVLVKEKFFGELLWGKSDVAELVAQPMFEAYKPYLEGELLLLYLRIHQYARIREEWGDHEEMLRYGIINVLQEIVDKQVTGEVFSVGEREFAVVVRVTGLRGERMQWSVINSLFTDAYNAMRFCFDVELSAGFDLPAVSSSQLRHQFAAAKAACGYAFLLGKGRIFQYRQTEPAAPGSASELFERVGVLQAFLNNPRQFQPASVMERLLVHPSEQLLPMLDAIKELYREYDTYLTDYLRRYGIVNPEITEASAAYKEELAAEEELSCLNECLEKLIRLMANTIPGTQTLGRRAMVYLEAHYADDDLSLSKLADILHVTDSYLSRVFVREYGANFVDILAKLRIQKALDLLNGRQQKISEVAASVGFKTPQHFNKVFKKVTGKTPSQYMKEA